MTISFQKNFSLYDDMVSCRCIKQHDYCQMTITIIMRKWLNHFILLIKISEQKTVKIFNFAFNRKY